MIRFKIDVMEALKNKGYTTTKIRKEKIIPEGTLTKIRNNNGEPVTTTTINVLCEILKKQPGQLLEWIPDASQQENTTE
jgi:putative transcriptional regulator